MKDKIGTLIHGLALLNMIFFTVYALNYNSQTSYPSPDYTYRVPHHETGEIERIYVGPEGGFEIIFTNDTGVYNARSYVNGTTTSLEKISDVGGPINLDIEYFQKKESKTE